MSNPALRPSGNPLLDDALDDAYQEDLEKGNLRKRRVSPAVSFTPTQWTSLGYWAHIDELTCEACGSTHSNLVGVFLHEHATGSPSTVRSTRLDLRAFRNLNLKPSLEIIPLKVALCAECVDAPLPF